MTDLTDSIDTTWCCVNKKVRKELKINVVKENLSFQQLSEIIGSILIPHSPYIIASYIYGSRARETNRPDSDVDIITFWKIVPELHDLKNIRDSIQTILGVSIDLVSCVRTAKNVHHYNLCDIAYFENVTSDARQIMGNTQSIMNLFESSYKMNSLRRN
jgi:predicted nucleotidyltransferase